MQPVMLLPHEMDTRTLRKALWQQRIGHQITRETDGQLLWLADPAQQDALEEVVARWKDGTLSQAAPRAGKKSSRGGLDMARRVPVTLALIVLSLAVFGLIGLFGDWLIVGLTIVPIGIAGDELVFGSLEEVLADGQLWRLLSPAFVHFGWTHLVFNLMWVWYFGRQVEVLQGSRWLLALVLIAGIGANLAQYAAGTVLFGGMSGVVYALLGHVWVMSRRAPGMGFFVPSMLVVFMLGWMVFTMTPAAGLIGFGNVANEAHVGGLLLGLAIGLGASSRQRRAG